MGTEAALPHSAPRQGNGFHTVDFPRVSAGRAPAACLSLNVQLSWKLCCPARSMAVWTAVRPQKPVAPSVWATVTQCHRLGSGKQTRVSHCSGAASPGPGLRRGLLTGPHTVDGKGAHSGAPFVRALIPCMRLRPCDRTAPKRPHLLTPSPWGLGLQPKNLGTACCPQETALSPKSLIAEAGDAPGDALRASMRRVDPQVPRATRQEARGATCVDQARGDHWPPKT